MTKRRFTLAALTGLALTACTDPKLVEPNPDQGEQPEFAQHGAETDEDSLKHGAVYSMSNARGGNVVVVFRRAPNGMLTEAGRYPTGGTGSGSFEDTSNGLVLGSGDGEAAPNNLTSDVQFLFATNAGSNSITVFQVEEDRLRLVETHPSGGEKPVSLTVNNGLLYVLHSGELIDDLIDANGNVIPNCTTGHLPSVTGFRVDRRSGRLTPIPGSTRTLSGDPFSGCAQVSFNPRGSVLVVTERTAVEPAPANNRVPAGDEGLIVTFLVEPNGTLGTKRLTDATGQGPFGFTFNKEGALFTSEQFDGPDGPGLGAAAGYRINYEGRVIPASASLGNGGTDSCWFVVTDDGRYGYVTSFFGTGRISSYRVGNDGSMRLLNATAAAEQVHQGASDLALSRNSNYLYQLNSFRGTINAFRIGNDGSLQLIQTVQAHPASAMAAPLGLASY